MAHVEILNTKALLFLARRADETERNRRVVTERLETALAPDGLHIVSFKFPHNDVEWRCHIMAKIKDQMDPAELCLDCSFEDYDWAITPGVYVRDPTPLEQLGMSGR